MAKHARAPKHSRRTKGAKDGAETCTDCAGGAGGSGGVAAVAVLAIAVLLAFAWSRDWHKAGEPAVGIVPSQVVPAAQQAEVRAELKDFVVENPGAQRVKLGDESVDRILVKAAAFEGQKFIPNDEFPLRKKEAVVDTSLLAQKHPFAEVKARLPR